MPCKVGDVAWKSWGVLVEMMVKWRPNPLEDFFFARAFVERRAGRVETYEFGIGHHHRSAISGRGLDRTCA